MMSISLHTLAPIRLTTLACIFLYLGVCFAPPSHATSLAYPSQASVWQVLFGLPPANQQHATIANVRAISASSIVSPTQALSEPGNVCDTTVQPHSLPAATDGELLKKLFCPNPGLTSVSASSKETTRPTAVPRLEGAVALDILPAAHVSIANLPEGSGTTSHVNVPISSNKGQLVVKTVPESATVRVVNIKQVFSQGMMLSPGEYVLDAFAPGYRTAVRRISLNAGEKTEVIFHLEPAGPQGRLFVKTEPAGAFVRILDIVPRFRQGMHLESGAYTVDAHLDGFHPIQAQTTIVAGQNRTITLRLQEVPPPGQLYVENLPAGAIVRVLDFRTKFSQGMSLPAGDYTLEIKSLGTTIHQDVHILSGQPLHVFALQDAPSSLFAKKRDEAPATVSMAKALALASKIERVAALEGPPERSASPRRPQESQQAQAQSPPLTLSFQPVSATVDTAYRPSMEGRLYVHTAPGNADIRILHAEWLIPVVYNEGMALPEGVYGISVYKDGHEPIMDQISISSNEATRLYIPLAFTESTTTALLSSVSPE